MTIIEYNTVLKVPHLEIIFHVKVTAGFKDILSLHPLDIYTQYNWSLQFFSQDYNLASHTTYVVRVNFIH